MSSRAYNCEAARSKFLDLEAAVDEEEEEEEEEEEGEEDDFIDNTNPESRVLRWKVYEASVEDNEQTAAMLEELANRYRREARSGHSEIPEIVDENIPSHLDGLVRLPSASDRGLWRVLCRHGIEEEAVFLLLQLANSEHEISSAFWRGSERGWIYVEATMNPKLLGLLTLTPGIIFHQPGSPIKYAINIEERVATLKLPNLDADNLKRKWANRLNFLLFLVYSQSS
ncbi:hypothetical protein H0H81_005258 [Sphagnurus paluster]|uniref:NGN domain-containing protein n=1 Tax=Sphagnurus paluster TaxID=117069 RepID=A0A9P7FQY2_9AGAR|nr:hypothetical protein H0H81_005258 [Sphagnurus paluster]